jgi:hypothetical protein
MLPWTALLLFMIAVAASALYGLTVSGHFPGEFRATALRTPAGAAILWVTLIAACAALLLALATAPRVLPWWALVIGGGAMLLAAPLLLRPFPDRFVNGRAGLFVFSAAAMASALALWVSA